MKDEEEFEAAVDLPPRLKELQKKIKDDSYINNAIDRIAVIISRQIVSTYSVTEHSAEMTF